MENQNKIIIAVVIATMGALFAGIYIAEQRNPVPEVTVTQNATAQTTNSSHDWGTIPLEGGNVTQTFTITNTGTDPLQLSEVQTSCMCTTAEITINGQISPQFGMHSKSRWLGTVPANQQAELKVTFDPAFHGPSGVGAITRQVTVTTNDQNNPKLTFNLTANVVN